MIRDASQGMLQVSAVIDRGSCDILHGRADDARHLDRARQPVDRAGPVENAQNAFPTRSLDAQNASTRSTGVLRYFDEQNKGRKMALLHPEEDHETNCRRRFAPMSARLARNPRSR